MNRTLQCLLLCLLSMGGIALAGTPELIGEAETRLYEAPLTLLSQAPISSDMGGPEILLVKPDVSSPLQSPMGMQILVLPKDGAQINWQSVQLLYGSLRFNITDRFLKLAQRDKEGYIVKAMNIPQGNHRLLILIQDSKNRTGRRELFFTVAGGGTTE